jgi:hypothetical protein
MPESGSLTVEVETRRRELEATFYRDAAEAHRDRLRVEAEEHAASEALGRASGIDDGALLERLAGLGVRPETLAALSLIPLVEVAWADGTMDPRERASVLAGAISTGLPAGSPSIALLEIWTADRPPPDLLALWRDFTRALCRQLDPVERARFGGKVVGRARLVAEAAGDAAGRPPGVSPEEAAVLADLDKVFAG